MSTLLDVLHKRSRRAEPLDLTPAEPVSPPLPEETGESFPTVELRLAAEPDPGVLQVPTAHTEALPGEERAGSESVAAAATPADAQRRWTDTPSGADAAVTGHVPARPPPRAPRLQPRPFLLVLAGLGAVAVGFVTWRLMAPAPESFLVDPGSGTTVGEESVPADPVVAAPGVRDAQATEDQSGEDEVGAPAQDDADPAGELAWYDTPALPPEERPEAAAAQPVIRITRGSTENPAAEKLREAYQAFQAGEPARSEALYREALARDPRSVDALLGLGALAAHAGRSQEAVGLYREVQRLEPRNAAAAAALSTLPGSADEAAGSRLKSLLVEQPGSAPLHFALGLHYAAAQRWPDAQGAFFEAVRHDPVNADYAFNLAVSLDRLGQASTAATYYQRALDLAAGGQQFNPDVVRARLAVLRGERS